MNAYIFLGPTLARRDAAEILDATYLPPVAQGDVYRAALRKPSVIGIVDGFFDLVPAVWHKEILWAMHQGVHVYGSASMGALRAAELAQFGMVGVGKIFALYRDGVLEDDDEVALVHGDAESGYIAGSEAMVNIRFTLERARSDGVIAMHTMHELLRLAKSLFYPRRSYETVTRQAVELGLPPGEIDALRGWLPTGKINQKRDDAISMLHAIQSDLDCGMAPNVVSYFFEHTEMWDHATRTVTDLPLDRHSSMDPLDRDDLLDEVRLNPGLYHRIFPVALARYLALRDVSRVGRELPDEAQRHAMDAFALEHGVTEPDELSNWLDRNGITRRELEHLVSENAHVQRISVNATAEIAEHIIATLRVEGLFHEVLERARTKQRVLDGPELIVHGREPALANDQLVRWYFEDVLGEKVPGDIESYAQRHGFERGAAFREAVRREHGFRQVQSMPRADHLEPDAIGHGSSKVR